VLLLFVRLLGAWRTFFVAHKARQAIAGAPRILLIHPGPLGALILTTSVLQALKTHLPDANVTLAVGPWSREVVANHPAIDHLLVYSFPSYKMGSPKGIRSYIAMILLARQLKRNRYDLAINLHRNFWWSAAVVYLAGILRRIGYAISYSPPFLTHVLPFQPRQHITVSHLKATSAGLEALISKPLSEPFSPEQYPLSVIPTTVDHRWVDNFLYTHNVEATASLLVIHPGTSVKVKQWRLEAWGSCVTALNRSWQNQSPVLFLLTGTPQERPLLEAISLATNARTMILDSTTVGQLAALLGRCRLALGVDSGPLHLAVAQGIPTLQIFGPIDPKRYGAWGSSHRHAIVASSHLCRGCSTIPCGRLHFQPDEIDSCVRLVSEQEVIDASFALIEATELALVSSQYNQRQES
jgi:ADP-heptose:LPS heptosyltransferase